MEGKHLQEVVRAFPRVIRSRVGFAMVKRRSGGSDPRDAVDAVVERHALTYSIKQLRLVGLLLLLLLFGRLLRLLVLLVDGRALERLAGLVDLSDWLLLLPIGISLYLLGGGQGRLRREPPITTGLHYALLPLGLACLLLLPALTISQASTLSTQLGLARSAQETRLANHRRWLEEANSAGSAAAIQQLARKHGIELPAGAADSPPLLRWRYEQVLEQRANQVAKESPTLSLSAWERGLLEPMRVGLAVFLQLLSGTGLLLLKRQGSREVRRHGVSPAQFFTSGPMRGRPTG
jgi:hypothetical protein